MRPIWQQHAAAANGGGVVSTGHWGKGGRGGGGGGGGGGRRGGERGGASFARIGRLKPAPPILFPVCLAVLFFPPRVVEKADQLADIARFQAGPRDAEPLRAGVHGGAVAPQRGGERDHGEGIGAGAQSGCVARALGAGAVPARAAAFGEDTFAKEGRARGFEIAQAGEEAEDVRDFLAL